MKKKTFSLISIFLVVIMLFSTMPFTAFAKGDDNKINIAKYAISFVNSIYGESKLKTSDVIEIINEDDALSGYCVNIVNNSNPNGYVVVKFSNNEPVVSEFSIKSGVENPYTEIIEKSDHVQSNKMTYYSIGPNEYHIYSPDDNVVLGVDELIPVKEFKDYKIEVKAHKDKSSKQSESLSNSDQFKGDFNYSSLDGWSVVSSTYSGTKTAGTTISGANSISYYGTSDVNAANKTYACSVVALSNMMKYYKYKGKSSIDSTFSTLYSSLWTHAGTNSSGSTSNGSEAPAAVAYMSSKGYSISYDNYWFDYYSDFTRDADANKPMIFTYGADFGGTPGGHAVFCVGYVTTTDYQYLQIADGWTSSLKYINFNGYSYSRKDGWSFTAP